MGWVHFLVLAEPWPGTGASAGRESEGGAVRVDSEALVEFRAQGGLQAGDFTAALHNCLFCYGIAMTTQ
jgi:hypothetical protein